SAADRARLAALCAQRSAAADEIDGYRLGPDDLLEVRIPDLLEAQAPLQASAQGGSTGRPAIGGAPSFQQGLRVDKHGSITIATLGLVPVAGLTPDEAEGEIARRLVKAGILDKPQVSVLVAEYRSRVAAVMGSVERPGMYPVTSRDTSLADLVALAGGPTREAGRLVVFTPSANGGAAAPVQLAPDGVLRSGEAPIRMDLEVLSHAQGQGTCALDPPARPGDVISVSPAGTVQVTGWVDKPGSVPVTRGLTVTGAIAAVGGNVFAADGHNVAVKRTLAPGTEDTIVVDVDAIADGRAKDVPLTDGDVVTVPSDNAKLVPYGVWSFAKEMIHVGGSIPLF
ncbi:polysaccharide export protein, partial [Candidatus Binatia bacterium]|nr:polysaccharide export protein [Candidatus Binatia bacterium]